MKVLLTGDIHFHKYRLFNQDNRRLKNLVDYMEFIFAEATRMECKYIVITGDLYNGMQIISTEVEDALIRVLSKCFAEYEVTVCAVSGNHDYATKNLFDSPAISALQHLATAFPDNFYLLDNGSYEDNNCTIQFIPYYEYPEHFRSRLESVSKNLLPPLKHYLVMHQTCGVKNPMIPVTMDVNDPLFDPFTMVFNGHIHDGEKVTDKFINIGSPMHRDAGDIGKRKGFWTVDLSDPKTLQFHDITDHYPQYMYKTEGEELTEWEKGQYIIFQPSLKAITQDTQKIMDEFNTTLSPAKLLENFCDETAPGEEDKVKYILQKLSL